MSQLALVVDLKKCISCHACTVACKMHNGIALGDYLVKVLNVGPKGNFPNISKYGLPKSCMQCKKPPCESVCPAGATEINSQGVVIINETKCVGCKYCMAACPYGARIFNESKGIVQKCDLCASRRDEGLEPACVQTCLAGARVFGDVEDPNSDASRLINLRQGTTLLPHLGTEPSVYYCHP